VAKVLLNHYTDYFLPIRETAVNECNCLYGVCLKTGLFLEVFNYWRL